MTFTVPLKEQTVTEGESVTLVCEVSKDNTPVQWLKDGKPITPDEHMQVAVEGEPMVDQRLKSDGRLKARSH